MGRYGRILEHPIFLEYIVGIEELEKDRIYCGHSLEHLLAVSRIAYIKVLEQKLEFDKDIVYAAGLLHDIGRVAQYRDGIPHEIAAVKPAEKILKDCGYSDDEMTRIITAVSEHRKKKTEDLSGIIYTADKQSRNCYVCKAADTCNWSQEKRVFSHMVI